MPERLESFLVRALGPVANRVRKQSAFAANGADDLKKFTPVNQWIEQKFIADFAPATA